ncbi:MAG: type II toxin-antitoxin system Phd/YefM family antitoxin [Actinobacteria bacterium]|nr:type II toxin-antitoxin system Phd/YefM family antitoxin [Actinomycetota bacterium]MBU4483687.1 type II toxin-antitoxin system Phd/YefM family antitoxin [Actinomycetota bacterium]MCG2791482.1 type II toxin-antitoxin system Phd/YefM family antitoxin [Actinomycetes bacterium]
MLKIKINEDVIIVGTSEFRNSINKFISILKDNKIILTNRNRPQAVLISFEEYEKIGEIIEELEDRYFGEIALERLGKIKSGESKILSHEEILKRYL